MINLLEYSLQNPFGQHWNSLNKDNVQEQILTGATQHGFKALDLGATFPKTTGALEDFGCGIGRNVDSIRSFFNPEFMVGYDLPNMINLMPLEVKSRYDKLTSDFEFIESIKPRIILASLCLQHIPTVLLMKYFERLAAWPCLLYVLTRRYNDGDKDDILDMISCSFNAIWLSRDAAGLYDWPGNPELHWSGIFAPRVMEKPFISLASL